MKDEIKRGPYDARAEMEADARLKGLLRDDFICLFFDPDDPEHVSWLLANLTSEEVSRLPFPFRRAIEPAWGLVAVRSA